MSQREVAIMPVYCSPYFAVVIVIMKVYRFSVNFLVCSYVVQCYLAAVWNDTERLCTEQMSFMWSEQITRTKCIQCFSQAGRFVVKNQQTLV